MDIGQSATERLRAMVWAAALLISLLCAGRGLEAQQIAWETLGPTGGRVNKLAIHPTDSRIVLAATEGGLYRTDDGGESWVSLSARMDRYSINMQSILIDAQNPRILFAGGWRSSDGGASWVRTVNSPGWGMVIDRVHDVMFGVGGSTWRSTDRGWTWEKLPSSALWNSEAIAYDEATGTVFVATWGGLVASTSDGGSTWFFGGPGRGVVNSVAVAPSDSRVVYAGHTGLVSRSVDGGRSWTSASVMSSGDGVAALAVDPIDARTVFAGGGYLYSPNPGPGIRKSIDGGVTWRAVNDGIGRRSVWDFAFDPKDPRIIYAAADGGVFKSTDGGETWVAKNRGLNCTGVRRLVSVGTGPRSLFAMTYQGLFETADDGSSWMAKNQGLTTPYTECLAADPNDSRLLYLGTRKGLFRSSGGAWEPTALVHATAQVIVDPADSRTLYALVGDGMSVVKSTDAAATWSWKGTSGFQWLLMDPLSRALYIGSSLRRSTDGATTWESLSGFGQVLAVDPRDSRRLVGASGGYVAVSRDAGETWKTMTTYDPFELTIGDITAIALHPDDRRIMYVGTQGNGVHYSTNEGASWMPLEPGLECREITSVLFDPLDARVVYATAVGSGVHRLIWPPSVRIVTPAMPSGDRDQAYYFQLSAVGGSPPYRWSVAAGVLPPGLTMYESGRIKGFPKSAGQWPLTLRVQDAAGSWQGRHFILSIASDFAIKSLELPPAKIGVPYRVPLGAEGGVPPLEWMALAGLPSGLALRADGVLEGVPSQPGPFTVTISVRDARGRGDSRIYSSAVAGRSLRRRL